MQAVSFRIASAAWGASALVVATFSLATQADAQRSSIGVGPDRPVQAVGPSIPISEPFLAANPHDPRHLVASAMVVAAVRPYRIDCAVFSSRDAGESWSRVDLGLPVCANSWVTVASDGAALLTTLASRGELLAYRARDGGNQWDVPVRSFGRGYDYPKIIHRPDRGEVYVVSGRAVRITTPDRRSGGEERYGIMVARSLDGGATFPDTALLLPSMMNMEAQTPVVLGDGTLLIPFTEHGTLDGRRLERQRSWLLASRDGGRTISERRAVAVGCDQRQGWASLAVDTSRTTHRDRIYWLCVRRDEPGVRVQHSDDAGRTWSSWVRIDQHEDAAVVGLPVMAVSRNGTLGVMWLRREATARGPCHSLFFSASLDGGASFLPPARVSSAPSCPAADPRNAVAHGRRAWGGDYNGLASTPDGRFHAVWADARDGIYALRHAVVTVGRR